jgi:hypothetical protein
MMRGGRDRPQLCVSESTVLAMTVDRLSARGGTDVGSRQSHGCLEGKRKYSFVTAIVLSQLHANSVLCEVDTAQLRQGHPAVGADIADFPENQAEWRVPRRMRRRPDPYGDVPAIGLEVQSSKLPRAHACMGQLLCELRQIRCSVHSSPPRPTDESVDLSQTSDNCSYDTRRFVEHGTHYRIPLAAEDGKAYARFPSAIDHPASIGCPAGTSSPQQSHVGTSRCCDTTYPGRVDFSARL